MQTCSLTCCSMLHSMTHVLDVSSCFTILHKIDSSRKNLPQPEPLAEIQEPTPWSGMNWTSDRDTIAMVHTHICFFRVVVITARASTEAPQWLPRERRCCYSDVTTSVSQPLLRGRTCNLQASFHPCHNMVKEVAGPNCTIRHVYSKCVRASVMRMYTKTSSWSSADDHNAVCLQVRSNAPPLMKDGWL